MTSLTIDDPQHKDYYNNVRFGEEAPVNDPAINREPGGMYEAQLRFATKRRERCLTLTTTLMQTNMRTV